MPWRDIQQKNNQQNYKSLIKNKPQSVVYGGNINVKWGEFLQHVCYKALFALSSLQQHLPVSHVYAAHNFPPDKNNKLTWAWERPAWGRPEIQAGYIRWPQPRHGGERRQGGRERASTVNGVSQVQYFCRAGHDGGILVGCHFDERGPRYKRQSDRERGVVVGDTSMVVRPFINPIKYASEHSQRLHLGKRNNAPRNSKL